MRAPQIAALALGANALLGLGLELGELQSESVMAAGIIAFVALDLLALAAFAAYRRQDRDLSPIGLGLWAVGMLASVYNSVWIVQLLLHTNPSYSVGATWYHAEVFGRAAGQLFIVVSLASIPRGPRLQAASIAWGGVTILALYFHWKLIGGGELAPDESARVVREISYAASLLLLGYIVVEADRLRRDREPPAARVVS